MSNHCVPCFVRQTLGALRLLEIGEELGERIMRQVLAASSRPRTLYPRPFVWRSPAT